MKKVYFDGITEMGSCIKCACMELPEDYTMTQVVAEVKRLGYQMFKLDTMKRFVKV